MGAVFAANVFANNPSAFAGYIIGSFVAPRDPGVVARVARASEKASGQRVFLAVGGAEDGFTAEDRKMRRGFADLKAALQGRRGVALEAKTYPGENHLSFYPNLVIDGFRFVLPPTMPVDVRFVALPETTIARYVGVYETPDGRKITVKAAAGGNLTLELADKPADVLLPNGPDRYYAYRSDLDVRFDETGLTLAGRGSATLRARREAAR
jgi:hypothetical protein